jgi:ribosomal protein L29
MNTRELKEKTQAEILTLIQEKREELRKISFGTAGSTMRNVHAGRNLRRDIARAMTELTSRNAHGA